jgi:cation:H+ antiporter
MDWLGLVLSLSVILGGAELFTNGVEWVGQAFGLSEGVVGSVLAAIGTALPETVLPLIAVLLGRSAGKEIGVGAILGAPLMLTTLAMFVLGASVLFFSRLRTRGTTIRLDSAVVRLDLTFFLCMFALAILAGVLKVRAVDWVLALVLVVAYGLYVRRHLVTPGDRTLQREAAEAIKPLYARRAARAALGRVAQNPHPPPNWASVAQALVGLGIIVGGARAFVVFVTHLSDRFHVPYLAFALLVAPVATELPEIFNASVIWARRGRDTLAVGNITGAMAFQAVFPVTVGLLFTPWRLSGEALVAAVVALGAGLILYGTLRFRGRLGAGLLLLQGAIYAGYVVYLVPRL